jgi:hypothetical protein
MILCGFASLLARISKQPGLLQRFARVKKIAALIHSCPSSGSNGSLSLDSPLNALRFRSGLIGNLNVMMNTRLRLRRDGFIEIYNGIKKAVERIIATDRRSWIVARVAGMATMRQKLFF